MDFAGECTRSPKLLLPRKRRRVFGGENKRPAVGRGSHGRPQPDDEPAGALAALAALLSASLTHAWPENDDDGNGPADADDGHHHLLFQRLCGRQDHVSFGPSVSGHDTTGC